MGVGRDVMWYDTNFVLGPDLSSNTATLTHRVTLYLVMDMLTGHACWHVLAIRCDVQIRGYHSCFKRYWDDAKQRFSVLQTFHISDAEINDVPIRYDSPIL